VDGDGHLLLDHLNLVSQAQFAFLRNEEIHQLIFYKFFIIFLLPSLPKVIS
jgi:hypothetical protein